MLKKMIEKDNWVILKDGKFPSTNYILFNIETLRETDKKRWENGRIPQSNVAFYGSYEKALERMNIEINESDFY